MNASERRQRREAPLYGPFSPDLLPDIYAVQACLLLIRCQNCGTEFKVSMSFGRYDIRLKRARSSLKDRIISNEIHYGDPPNMHCCPAGPTMNSVPLRVLEFWMFGDRARASKWKRVPDLEREIKCDWADEEP